MTVGVAHTNSTPDGEKENAAVPPTSGKVSVWGVVQEPEAVGTVVEVVTVVEVGTVVEVVEVDEPALGTVVVDAVSGTVVEALAPGPVVVAGESSADVVLLDPDCGLLVEASTVVLVVVAFWSLSVELVSTVELVASALPSSPDPFSAPRSAAPPALLRGPTVAGGGAITSLLTTPTPAQAIVTAPILATTHSAARAKDLMGQVWRPPTGVTPKGSLKVS